MELIGVGEDSSKGWLSTITSLLKEKTDRSIETARRANFGIVWRRWHCTRDWRIWRDTFTSKWRTAWNYAFYEPTSDKPTTKLPVISNENEATQEIPTTLAATEQVIEDSSVNDDSTGGMSASSSQNSSNGKNTRTKLPKLILPKFKGDVTSCRGFWRVWEVQFRTIRNLRQLTSLIICFLYWKGKLFARLRGWHDRGQLPSSNWHLARVLWENAANSCCSYGRTVKKSACDGDKSKQLRFVYDKVSTNVRALEALGTQSGQYGSLVIPVIMLKLPSDVRLQIARKTERDVWVIKDLLESVRKEVEARELSEQVKANNEIKRPPTSRVPATASMTTQEAGGSPITPIMGVYCGKRHYSASCETVVLPNERKDILRRTGWCFVCLRLGHRSNQCLPSRKCRPCQRSPPPIHMYPWFSKISRPKETCYRI